MVYGERGGHPIKSKMIGFWQRLVNEKQAKLSNKHYSILLAMHNRDVFPLKMVVV